MDKFVWCELNNLWLNLTIINLWIGPPLESGPTPTLPDKKMLEVILDRIQKYVFFLYNNLVFVGFFSIFFFRGGRFNSLPLQTCVGRIRMGYFLSLWISTR